MTRNIKTKRACEIFGRFSGKYYDNPGHLQCAIVQCSECGFVFSDMFIENRGYLQLTALDPLVYRNVEMLRHREAPRVKNILSEIVSLKKTGKLLDVGCGHGFLLTAAKAQGFQVLGVELQNSSAIAGKNCGLDIITGEVTDAGFQTDFFDIVVMSEVLEHMLYPKKCLEETRRILKKDGYLYIVVPNVESYQAKNNPLWWSEYHLNHFSLGSLSKLIEVGGFVPVKEIINLHVPSIFNKVRRNLYSLGIARTIRYLLSFDVGKRVSAVIPTAGITMICRKA